MIDCSGPQSVGDLGFQDFHQRTLSASSSSTAKLRCYAAAVLIPTFGIPPALVGAVAASTGVCECVCVFCLGEWACLDKLPPTTNCSCLPNPPDWNRTSYGLPTPHQRGQTGLILPLALQHLTPPAVSVVGIAAVAAAVMSSCDSALLSSASIFSSNIYKRILRTTVSFWL